LRELIEEDRVALIGPVRQELLSGIKDTAQFERLRTNLAAFEDEAVMTADYEEAARLDNFCRGQGLVCGPIDILLCSVARSRKWSLWTRDQRLERCVSALRGADQMP
jgi:predicted nucleic acid-binding protein